MKDRIKAMLLEAGFDAAGVARPEPATWEKFAEWLDRGYHGEMAYLERRRVERSDPASVLGAGAGSVIAVGKNYFAQEPPRGGESGAVFSRYARGDDYHAIMGRMARPVCDWIRERTGGAHKARWCVDTAPLLERDFAARAGIGWVGKHANVLSREWGNWLFLGAIVTTLPLEPDDPAPAHCGTCERCLRACPTDAFVSPYTLDARRCVSYLTIELKGPIPRELRPLVGRRVFGCDDCLEVCPWNRFARAASEPGFRPRPDVAGAELTELMGINEEEFGRRFKNSPVKRTKRRGLLRNVAVALGNAGGPAAVPALEAALRDPEPLVRGHAAWALGRIGGERARRALASRLEAETDPFAAEEIRLALDPKG